MSLLDQLMAEANNNQYEDLSSYEADEALEIENYLVHQKGFTRGAAKTASRGIVKHPNKGAFNQIKQEMKLNAGRGGVSIYGSTYTPEVAAQISLSAKITTRVAGASVLPVALFGSLESKNGYKALLDGLNSGVTVAGYRAGIVNGATTYANVSEFEYSDGTKVQVSSPNIPYPMMLESMNTTLFRLSKIRAKISDATVVAQFDQLFRLYKRTGFGKLSYDSVTLGAYQTPEQQQSGIVDVDGDIIVGREQTIVLELLNHSLNFTLTLHFFIEAFNRN